MSHTGDKAAVDNVAIEIIHIDSSLGVNITVKATPLSK